MAENSQSSRPTTRHAAGEPQAPRKGVRQERAIERRRFLSEVVMQLVQQRGFDAISVNEVAARASMSIGGLYRHISTKSDLLELVCDDINLNLLEDMKEAAAAKRGVSAKLEAVIRVYWDRHWDCANAILVAYREYQSMSDAAKKKYTEQELQFTEYFGDLIRAGIAVDEFRAVDERLLAQQIVVLSHMRALKSWSFKDRHREQVFAEVVDLIFSRLRPIPSR